MGSDDAIVQAARVSYGRGTKRIREDRGLIRFLMRHRHTTPFEMCEIKLHVRAPMDCWRQWIRHRTANVNEYSTRYSVAIEAAQLTPPDAWRTQATQNRQGSGAAIDTSVGAALSAREEELHRLAREVYEERLSKGVAREQARKDLPLSTYTVRCGDRGDSSFRHHDNQRHPTESRKSVAEGCHSAAERYRLSQGKGRIRYQYVRLPRDAQAPIGPLREIRCHPEDCRLANGQQDAICCGRTGMRVSEGSPSRVSHTAIVSHAVELHNWG